MCSTYLKFFISMLHFVLSKKRKKNGSKKGKRNLHFAPYIFKIISKKTEFENHFL